MLAESCDQTIQGVCVAGTTPDRGIIITDTEWKEGRQQSIVLVGTVPCTSQDTDDMISVMR